jgi:hypothetical protein
VCRSNIELRGLSLLFNLCCLDRPELLVLPGVSW